MRHRQMKRRRHRVASTAAVVLTALVLGNGLLPAGASDEPEQPELAAVSGPEAMPEPEPTPEPTTEPEPEAEPKATAEPEPAPAAEAQPTPKEPTTEAPTPDEPKVEAPKTDATADDGSTDLVAEGIPPGVTRTHWSTVENAMQIHAVIAAKSTDVQARIVSVSAQSSPWASPGRLTSLRPSDPPVSGSYRLEIRNRSTETVDVSYEIFTDQAGPVKISTEATGSQRWLEVTTRLVRDDGTPVTGAQVTGTVGGADGKQYPFEMSEVGDGGYRYANGTLPDGQYIVGVRAVVDGVEYRAATSGRVVGGAEAPQLLFDLSRDPNAYGWYTGGVRASFTAVDPDGVDWVRYKVGDDDTGEITGNHGSVLIDSDGVHEVLAWAMDSWGNASDPVSRTVRVDTTAPQTATNGVLSAGRVNQGEPATADFTCHDSVSGIDSCRIRLGGGEPQESGQPIVTSGAGPIAYEILAVNGAGLETRTTGTIQVVPDSLPPTAMLRTEPAPNARGWHNGPVTAIVSAGDAQTGVAWIEYRIGDGEWTRVNGDEARFPLDGQGENTIWFRTADNAGNVTMDHSRQLNIDTVAPEVTVEPGLDGRVVRLGSALTAAFECEDATSGVESCIGSTPNGAALPTDTLGSRTLTVTGTDNAGNIRVARAVYTVVAEDVELPEITATPLTEPGPAGWWSSDVEVDLVAGGSGSTVHWELDGASTGGGSATDLTTVTISSPGVTQLSYWAEDEQGQRGERGQLTISIDGSEPVIDLGGVLERGQVAQGAEVAAEFSCADAESGITSCLLRFADGTELQPGDRIDTSTTGLLDYEVIALNGAGLETRTAGTLDVSTEDTTAPALELTTEPAASNARGWFRRDVTVSIAASDAGSGVAWLEHRIDDGPWMRAEGSRVDVPVTGNGVTRVGYRAADVAGNRTGERTREIRLDKVDPQIAIDPSIDGARVERGMALTAVFDCTDEPSGIDTCVGSVPNGAPLPTDVVGTYELTVTATDRAGNLTRAAAQYTVVPSWVPAATAEPDRPARDEWWNDDVRITLRTLEGTDAKTVHWELEGAQTGSGSAEGEAVVTVSTEGVTRLYYWAQDAEGGAGEPVRFDVQIDRTPPRIAYTGLPSDDRPLTVTLGEQMQVEAVCSDAGGSGLDTCESPLLGGSVLPTDQAGEFRLASTATDVAGNETVDELVYRVVDPKAEEPDDRGEPGGGGKAPGGRDGVVSPAGSKERGHGLLPSTGGSASLWGIALATLALLGGSLLLRERRR